jgi:hypothetical protein
MTLDALIIPVLAFAASWGGIRVSLNGTRENVREIKGDVKDIKRDVSSHGERIAGVEARLEDRRLDDRRLEDRLRD